LFIYKKRLRKETRHRPVVVVDIVNRVGIELNLTIVELEVRGVRKVTISVRIITTRPSESLDLEIYLHKIVDYILKILNFI